MIERAIEIALQAHRGQKDRAGEPYILHPLWVMCQMETAEARIAAMLHDVVEDSDWTLDDLAAEGLTPQVLAAVDRLTRRPGEPYEVYVERAGAHPLARTVKIADLRHNLIATRIANPTERDEARMDRYRRALESLGAPEP